MLSVRLEPKSASRYLWRKIFVDYAQILAVIFVLILLSLQPGELVILKPGFGFVPWVSDWGVQVFGWLMLLGVVASSSLAGRSKPFAALGVLAILNPFTIIGIYLQSDLILTGLLIGWWCVFVSSTWVVAIRQRSVRSVGRGVLSSLLLIIFIVLWWQINEVQSGYGWQSLGESWLSVWQQGLNPGIILAQVVLLFACLRFRNAKGTVSMGLAIGALLLGTLVSLPVLQGSLVSPQYRVSITGLELPLAQLASSNTKQNILLIQPNLRTNNVFGQEIGSLTPVIEQIGFANVIALDSGAQERAAYIEILSYLDTGITAEIAQEYGISHVLIASGASNFADTKWIDAANLEQEFDYILVEYDMETNATDIVEPVGLSYIQSTSDANRVILEFQNNSGQERTILRQVEHELSLLRQNNRLDLGLVSNDQTVTRRDLANVEFVYPKEAETVYAVVNNQPLAKVNLTENNAVQLNLPTSLDNLESVRLYRQYDATNVLRLTSFFQPSVCAGDAQVLSFNRKMLRARVDGYGCIDLGSIQVNSLYSTLVEMRGKLDVASAAADVSVCLYNADTDQCVATLSLTNTDPQIIAAETASLATQNMRVQLRIQPTSVQQKLDVRVRNLSINEYELFATQDTQASLGAQPYRIAPNQVATAVLNLPANLNISPRKLTKCGLNSPVEFTDLLAGQQIQLQGGQVFVQTGENSKGHWCLEHPIPSTLSNAATAYLISSCGNLRFTDAGLVSCSLSPNGQMYLTGKVSQ